MNEIWNGLGEDPSVEDEFASAVMQEEVERRRLEVRGRESAEVMVDLEQQGPLYKYMRKRREKATKDLMRLVDVAPGDVAEIASLQASVREYLMVANWIDAVQQDGDEAAAEIKRNFGNGEEEQQDYYGD